MRTFFSVMLTVVLAGMMFLRARENFPSAGIQAEYRFDALDYSDIRKHFIRDRASVFLARTSTLSFSHIYIQDDDSHRYTWNIRTGDLISHADVILGHYHLCFGTGLLVGYSDRRETDPFVISRISRGGQSYRLCQGGFPEQAFHGGLVLLSGEFNDVNLSLMPFFSLRDRYVSWDEEANRVIEKSFENILNHPEQSYNRLEPVAVTDAGACASVLMGLLCVQTYFVCTELSNETGCALYLRHPHYYTPLTLKEYYGWGVFMQYRDRFTRIFFELDLPFYRNQAGIRTADPGFVAGIDFNYSRAELYFTATWCGPSFFSYHGSPAITPGRSWQTGFTLKPAKGLKTGLKFSSEKRNAAGRTDLMPRSTIREGVFLDYRFTKRVSVYCSGKNLEEESGRGTEQKIQARMSLKMTLSAYVDLAAAGVYQYHDTGDSGSATLKITVKHKKLVRCSLLYAPYFICGKNTIYSRILPVPGAVSPGITVRQDSHIAAYQLRLDIKGFTLTGRHQIHSADFCILSHQAEILAGYQF